MAVDVVLVTPGLEKNATGRTYSLWLLCRALGLSTAVVDLNRPTSVWHPLSGSEFADDCHQLDVQRSRAATRTARRLMGGARYTIAVKAIPESMGRALVIMPDRSRLIVDMDDPDSEVETIWLSAAERRYARFFPRYRAIRALWHIAMTRPRMVSNPVLREMYGGTIIPHVRADPPLSGRRDQALRSKDVRVAFIGTAREHKGIGVLRTAVGSLASAGFTLTVTDTAPYDARPGERWVGLTTLEEGIMLLNDSDIVAVPSLPTSYARAQFPVKIVDALLAARPIVASDFDPLPWAVGPGGVLVPPGDSDALALALTHLSTSAARSRIGSAGREYALANYTVSAVTPTFASFLADADRHREG